MHDLRVPDGKRATSRQDLRAVHSQTAVCGAFRMHNAHILPKPAHFGCMAAKCCHEPALFPSKAPSGTHETKKLPRIAARECITAKYCQGRQPGNTPRRYLAAVGRRGSAPRHNLATVGRPKTHHGNILPRQTPFKNASRRHLAEKTLGCPGLQQRASGARGQKRTAARTTTKQAARRPETQPRAPPQRFSLQQQADIATKSQWCHEVGRPRPNEASGNSTTHANTSKKP